MLKRLFFILSFYGFFTGYVSAQTTITFRVDITDFLSGGGTINNAVHIAGNFTTRGGNLPDWSPASGAMTNTGANIWERTVTFNNPSATDSLLFKYVRGNDWSFGDEGANWNPPSALCARPSDFNNRKLLVPASGSWIVTSKWAQCHELIQQTDVTVSTLQPSIITTTSAQSGGTVASSSNTPILVRGVVWSTSANPTVALGTKTTDGSGTGAFTSNITGLTANTQYFVRAYATTADTTVYGNQVTFTTLATEPTTTTITFKVDITDYLAGGGTINNAVHIAGNFASRSGNLPDWNPGEGGMTNEGNNIWSRTVVFTNPNTTDSLNWKYVRGSNWTDGDEGSNWNPANPSCVVISDNNNRKMLVPPSGNWVVFSKWAECPTITQEGVSIIQVSTATVSNITTTTATSGGSVSVVGNAAVTARGVVWSTSANPTVALSTKTTDGSGTGAFTSNITGLTANTQYFVRAYATTADTTVYGNQVTFTTLATEPTTTTITFKVDITDYLAGGGTINNAVHMAGNFASRGGNLPDWNPGAGGMTNEGNNIWSRTVVFTNPNTTDSLNWKYVRGSNWTDGDEGSNWNPANPSCVVISDNNNRKMLIPPSGNWVVFSKWAECSTITQEGVSIIQVSTATVSNITTTTATSGGSVSVVGNAAVTARGVVWSTSANPTVALSTKTTDGSGTGAFTSNITGLTANTQYFVRAYATTADTTVYGNELTFTTVNPALPTLTTTAITQVTDNSATSGGNISSEGGAAVTARGVCWSTSPAPTVNLPTKTLDGNGIGEFSSNIENLNAGTMYYVRAYATNAFGTAYGQELTFTTNTGTVNDSALTVIFRVDINDFLAGGGTINNVVAIAGNFESRGGNLPDWSPQNGAMTNEGNNVWTRTVYFNGTATDSLYWKYVRGLSWDDGDEGSNWNPPNPACVVVADFNNRKFLLPQSGTLILSSKWAQCHEATITSAYLPINQKPLELYPNPASDYVYLRLKDNYAKHLQLFSANGREVRFEVQQVSDGIYMIQTRHLKNGIYLLRATNANGENQLKRLVINR